MQKSNGSSEIAMERFNTLEVGEGGGGGYRVESLETSFAEKPTTPISQIPEDDGDE